LPELVYEWRVHWFWSSKYLAGSARLAQVVELFSTEQTKTYLQQLIVKHVDQEQLKYIKLIKH